MVTETPWRALKVALHREAEAIFRSSGEVVLVDSSEESDSQLSLISRTRRLKVSYVPERNAVRWETTREYGFERLPESTGPLAASLVKRVHPKLGPKTLD